MTGRCTPMSSLALLRFGRVVLPLAFVCATTDLARAQAGTAERFRFQDAPLLFDVWPSVYVPTRYTAENGVALDVDNDGDRDVVRNRWGFLEAFLFKDGVLGRGWGFDPSTTQNYFVNDLATG